MRAAIYLARASGTRPSVRRIDAIIRAAGDGKSMRTRHLMTLMQEVLSADERPKTGNTGQHLTQIAATVGQRIDEGGATLEPISGNSREISGNNNRIRIERDTEVGDAIASPPSRAKGERVSPASKPLPELPPEVADDVERLIAFDAAQRADGRISQGKIDEGMRRLRRAFERHGLDALLEGIEVAIGKQRGLLYAAGCVRNRGTFATTTPPSLFSGIPPREPADEGHDFPNYFRPKATV